MKEMVSAVWPAMRRWACLSSCGARVDLSSSTVPSGRQSTTTSQATSCILRQVEPVALVGPLLRAVGLGSTPRLLKGYFALQARLAYQEMERVAAVAGAQRWQAHQPVSISMISSDLMTESVSVRSGRPSIEPRGTSGFVLVMRTAGLSAGCSPTVAHTFSLSASGVSFREKGTHVASGFVAKDAGRLWRRVSMGGRAASPSSRLGFCVGAKF